jgi:hypothetical protein
MTISDIVTLSAEENGNSADTDYMDTNKDYGSRLTRHAEDRVARLRSIGLLDEAISTIQGISERLADHSLASGLRGSEDFRLIRNTGAWKQDNEGNVGDLWVCVEKGKVITFFLRPTSRGPRSRAARTTKRIPNGI